MLELVVTRAPLLVTRALSALVTRSDGLMWRWLPDLEQHFAR